MKKLILSSALLLATIITTYAQPIINKNDMPSVGDTIRLSITNNVNGIDYTLTGPSYTWDFSSLTEQIQRVDTFVAVSTTPLLYQADFNNPFDTTHKANFAQPQPDITQMPNVQFTEVFNFFRASDYTYTQVGQGAKVNSVPMPIKYNDPDLLYTFPLTYGATDSSEYSYNMNIPSLGYYGETKKRVNVVDGWGTLITPYDTLPAIRVFSTCYIHDSIYLDTIGYGFAQDRTEKEYKWLADTIGLPALKVLKRGGGGNVSIEYKYKFIDHTGLADYPYTLTFCSVWPNPATEESQIYFSLANNANVEVYISDILGKKLFEVTNMQYSSGFHSESLAGLFSLSEGVYLVTIKSGNNSKALKIQK